MAQNPIVTIEMEDGALIRAELYPETAPNTVRNFISLTRGGFYDGLCFHRVIPGFVIQGGCPDGTGLGGPGYSIKGEFSQNGFPNQLLHERGVLSMARTMDPDSAGSQFFIVQCGTPMTENDAMAYQFQWTVNKLQREIDLAPVDQAQAVLEQAQGKLNGYQQNGLSQELLDEYQPAVQRYKEVGGTPHLDYKHTVFGQVISGMEVVDIIAGVKTGSGDKPSEDVKILGIQVNE